MKSKLLRCAPSQDVELDVVLGAPGSRFASMSLREQSPASSGCPTSWLFK